MSMKQKLGSKKPVKIFISYAREDQKYKDELIKQLSSLQLEGLIESWDDKQIAAGTEWDADIRRRLEEAQVILILISSDAMASEYIQSVEIKRALERYHEGKMLIIPVLIRPCDWSVLGVDKFLGVPRNGNFISSAPDKDEAYLSVVTDLRKTITNLEDLLAVKLKRRRIRTAALAALTGSLLLIVAWFLFSYLHSAPLTGYVETHEGQPEANARVELYDGQARVAFTNTDQDGRFTFDRMSKSKSAKLQVYLNNNLLIDTTFAVASTLRGGGLLLQLPPVDAPFRVTHYDLDAAMLTLLLEGRLGELDERFAGTVIRNAVWRDLKYLYDTFGDMANIDNFVLRKEARRNNVDEIPVNIDTPIKLIGGARNFDDYNDFIDVYTYLSTTSLTDTTLAFIKKYPWHMYGYNKQSYEVQDFADKHYLEYLWRFTKPEDFSLTVDHPSISDDLLRHLTRDAFPEGFGITFLNNFCSANDMCSDEQEGLLEGIFLTLLLPKIKVQVVQVENISQQAIRFNNILFKEGTNKTLRYASKDTIDMATVPVRKVALSIDSLEPGESLIFPLRIYFEYEQKDLEGLREVIQQPLEVRAEGVQYFAAEVIRLGKNTTVQCPVLAGLTYGSEIPNVDLLDETFVYATSIRLEEIELSNASYAVRQLDPNALRGVLSGVGGVGSCPYIFSHIPEDDSWLNEGHILYRVDAKHKERYDKIKLRIFNGKIQIRELDPETSYLDHLFIVIKNAAGEELHLSAGHALLNKNDGNYLILDQGDIVELSFEEIPEAFRTGDVYVHAKGYYIPYQEEQPILD